MKKLGLVTGLGVGAGIFYYKELVAAHQALGLNPKIVMVHADERKVRAHAANRELKELAHYLAALMKQLKDGGAEIACIPAFAPQVCEAELNKLAPLPLISPIDVIVDAANKTNYRRLVILGARVTMETELFGKLKGFNIAKLSSDDFETVASTYQRIVENGAATEEQFQALRTVAHGAIATTSADAVILAGTDLAFVFDERNADFPHLDGARLHIAELVKAMQ